MQENPVLVLFDLGRDFEQRADDGAGLSRGESRVGQRVRPERMVEDIGTTRQEEPHGVGEKGRRGGAVAVEVTLDRLNIVLTIPTGAVEVFIHGYPLKAGHCYTTMVSGL